MDRLPILPDRDRPLIFAHRGLSSEAPENTMAAFKLAAKYNIPGVELDVHLTTDGKLVVTHDYSPKRVSPENDVILETLTAAEIQKFDVGSFKGAEFKNERIPLLTELFEELGDKLYFDIEIKSEKTEDKGLEATLVKIIKDFKYGAERITISSFNPIALKRFKALCPYIPTAIIYCNRGELPWYLHNGTGRWIGGTDYLKPEYVLVKKNNVNFGRHIGGRPVVPWTVDSEAEAERVLKAGCDGVISNCPHKLGLPILK